MTFTNPNALWLLLILPVLAVIGWPRLAYRRRRDVASLVIRLVLVALVIIGLARPQIERTADKLAVVFLVDVSHSVEPVMQQYAQNYVQLAADAMRDKDLAAVVVFGSSAQVEAPMRAELELIPREYQLQTNTDLAEAMRLGLALFPSDTAKRMVILSDGEQTVGDAADVAQLAAATGVQVDYVSLPEAIAGQSAGQQSEVMITDVSAPAVVQEGSPFNLAVTIATNLPTTQANIRILSAGKRIYPPPAGDTSLADGGDGVELDAGAAWQTEELTQGDNTFVYTIPAPAAGLVDLTVEIDPLEADEFEPNNTLSTYTEVVGAPRVLLVTNDENEIRYLQPALEEAGLQVDVRAPRDLRIGLAPLSSYKSIVLANVSAADLSPDRMEFLQAYVRDLGGGLVAIGGPDSYGVGGYYDTPLEQALPVDMRIEDPRRIPQMTMLFVIDRSGSMEIASTGSVTNLELAKEAVVRSFDLLDEQDKAGVLSFDTSAYFVLDIQELGDDANRAAMRDQVASLRPGGGTNIHQGMLAADRELSADDAAIKHIILLTDGGERNKEAVVRVAQRIYDNYDITTSVVAVGRDNEAFLRDVAAAGRGKFHLTDRASNIPAIFTAEMLRATKAYIVNDDFTPAITAPRHPILAGLAALDQRPPLKGYIVTSPKEAATVILRGPQEDPILAAWQYGLGRAVAFTSDAALRWAENWVAGDAGGWPDYADFWSQIVQWTVIQGNIAGNDVRLEARVVEQGKQARLIVNARDEDTSYLNGLDLNASVVHATNAANSHMLTLPQVAPGRYEASFTPQDTGTYFITIQGTPPDSNQPIGQTTGWILSYSAEYRVDLGAQAADSNLLTRIADVTGGASLRDTPEAAFLHNLDQEQAAQPIWHYFLLAALILLPVDVAVRRLVVTRRDLANARAAVQGWLGMGQPPSYQDSQTAAQMGRLRQAKDRARTANRSQSPPPPDATRPTSPPRPDSVPEAPARSRTPRPEQERKTAASRGTLASQLLEKRRGSSDRDDTLEEWGARKG
jgi:uncharacterized membrane protein